MPAIDYTLPLDQLPDPLPIEPLTRPFDVTITPPGSKSITCRAYVLAALAQGESKLIRPLRADDTDLLLKALCTLGAEARWEGEDVYITGVGGRFPRGGSVNLGDGGTPTRFMIACACLAAEPVVVDGSKRMRERPIAEGVEMLRQLGARIEYVEAEGRLPVRVTPSDKFVGGEIEVGQTQSSQFISALMLIAAFMRQGLIVRFTGPMTSRSYIDLSSQSLMDWGVDFAAGIPEQPLRIPAQTLSAQRIVIEPDASSAAYWIVAAAILNASVRIPNLAFDSQQPDVYVAKHLQPAIWDWKTGREWGSDVRWPAAGSNLSSFDLSASLFPDGAIALSIAACQTPSMCRITGLGTLRVKETDRIAALANELRKVGCSVETGEDWIEITPAAARANTSSPPAEPGATGERGDPIIIETYNDHRMAMAFAVLGLAAPNGRRLAIRNPACVAKSYPTFWRDFAKLYQ